MKRRAYGEATSFAQDNAPTDGSPGDRCTFQAHEGRCCLRGHIGPWGKMLCSFHYAVVETKAPHTKAEFAAMINRDRERGYDGWDHLGFEAWWEKVTGRSSFPAAPKSALRAAEERVQRELDSTRGDLDAEHDQEMHRVGLAAIQLAEAFRPRMAS